MSRIATSASPANKCRACAKTFNALTATPLVRLWHKDKWEQQAEVLRQGLSVH